MLIGILMLIVRGMWEIGMLGMVIGLILFSVFRFNGILGIVIFGIIIGLMLLFILMFSGMVGMLSVFE